VTRRTRMNGSLGALDGSRSASNATVARHFASVRGKLDSDLENVVFTIFGDSTGVGDGTNFTETRWPWQLTQRLAALYPTKTVIFKPWNVATTLYDANVTVQTGTGTGNAGGPFLITIYNGSASGMNTSYSGGNLSILCPVAPDLVFINHGHNQTGAVDSNVNVAFYQLIRNILRFTNPNAAVVVIGQNPQTSPATSPPLHLQRMNRLREMCATEEWGFVDVTRAFLDTPDWANAGLVKTDGVHPADPAGNTLWINTIWDCFAPSKFASPAASPAKADRIFIPASEFIPSLLIGGTPSAAVLNSFLPVLSYSKQAGTVGASTVVHVPSAWKNTNVWVWWTTTDGAAGNVAWQMDRTYLTRIGFESISQSSSTVMSMTLSSPVAGVAPTAAYAEAHTLVLPLAGFNLGATPLLGLRSTVIRVARAGADALDTYAGTAHLYGVVLERGA